MVQLESPKLVRGGDESGKESGDSEVGNYSTQTAFLPRDLWSNFFIQTAVAKKVNTFHIFSLKDFHFRKENMGYSYYDWSNQKEILFVWFLKCVGVMLGIIK